MTHAMVPLEVAGLGNAVIGIMTKIQEFGNNCYKHSNAWDAFPGQLECLRRTHDSWENNFKDFGMLSELKDVLSTAKSSLEKEEAKLRTRNSIASCCMKFKAMLFPEVIGMEVERVIDAYNRIRDMLKAEVDDLEVVKKLASIRIASLPPRQDNRYVPFKDSEHALYKALNDTKGAAVILLHGGPGRGKSTVAKAIEQHYKENKNLAVFDHVFFFHCGADASTLDLRFQLLQLLQGFDATVEVQGQQKEKAALVIRNLLISLLKTRKVLIILDDTFQGHLVESIIQLCGSGVKVLVTTQNAELCREIPNSLPILIQDVEKEDARKILARHAGIMDEVIPSDLQNVMDEMINVTEANPLALASLASAIIPSRRRELDQWKAALQGLVVMLDSVKASIYGERYPRSFFNALRASLEPLLGHPARRLLILTSICGGPSVPEEIIEFLYGRSICGGDLAMPFLFLRNELESREWLTISSQDVGWNPMDNRTRFIWSMHSLRRLFIEAHMTEERTSLFATFVGERELKLDLENLAEERITVTVLCALYLSEQYAQTAADKLGIPLKGCDRLRRNAIEPIICLLGHPIGENWTAAAYACLRQVFVRYICYGMLDDYGVSHLLTCPVSALATLDVLRSITMIEDKPFLDESKQCIMKTLVEILEEDGERTMQVAALIVLTRLARNFHHGKFVASFPGVWEGSMQLLTCKSEPELQIFATELLSELALTQSILKYSGTLSKLAELLSMDGNVLLQNCALLILSKHGTSGHEDIEEILNFSGLLTQIVDLLAKPETRLFAGMVISNLTSGRRLVKIKILKFPGLLDKLVELLYTERDTNEFIEASGWQVVVAMGLANLACEVHAEINWKILHVPGLLDALVDAMSKHDNIHLQGWAVRSLANLATGGNDSKAKILKFPGVLGGLVDLLSKHRKSPGSTEAVKAICGLALGGVELKLKLVKFPGVLHELVELLFKHDNAQSQKYAANALACLALAGGEITTDILKFRGVLEGLVEMLSSKNALVQQSAADSLCNLGRKEGEIVTEIPKFPGVLDGLVKMLCTHENVDLQVTGALTLASLGNASHEIRIEMLKFPGLLKGLVDLAVTSDNGNLIPQEAAVCALCNLASGGGGGDENLVEILKFPGAVAGLAELLYLHESPCLQQFATHVFAKLTFVADEMKAEILKCPRVLGGLTELLFNRSDSGGTQRYAAVALTNLALVTDEFHLELMESSGALPALMELLTMVENDESFFADHEGLQLSFPAQIFGEETGRYHMREFINYSSMTARKKSVEAVSNVEEMR